MAEATELVRKMNRGVDRKDEVIMAIDPYCNWESLLLPAPTSIAILGQLMVLASKIDFSLTKKTPEGGFKFLHHPSSFRACLVQISNEGCDAFMKANKNMDKIRIYTTQFEKSVTNAVKLLLRGSVEERKIIPDIFEEMKTDANTCLQLAIDTEDGFEKVMRTLEETSETSAAVKGVYEDKYKEAEAAQANLKEREKRTQERLKMVEEERKQIMERVASATAAHEKSIDDMPGVGTLLACNMAEDAMQILSGAVNLFGIHKLTKTIGGAATAMVATFTGKKDDWKNPSGPKIDIKTQEDHDAASFAFDEDHVGMIMSCAQAVFEMFEKVTPENSSEENIKIDMEKVKANIEKLKGQFDEVCKDMKDSQFKTHTVVKYVISVCEKGESLGKDLKALLTNMDALTQTKIKPLYAQADLLLLTAHAYQKKAQEFHGANAAAANPSGLEKAKQGQGRTSSAELAVENAKYAIEAKKKQLDEAKKEQRRVQQQQRENEEKLDKTLSDLRQVDLNKVDFQKIQETLRDGIVALSQLKEQWGNLVLMFSKMTNILEVSLKIQTERLSTKVSRMNYTLGNATKDMILDMAASVSAVAYATHGVADTYVQISEKHLIGNTSALVKLIAYNPEKEDEKRALEYEREKLQDKCDNANEEIKKLATERRQQAVNFIEEKKRRLEEEVEPLLPALPPAKAKFIEMVVQNDDVMPTEEDIPNEEEVSDYL